MSFCHKLWFSNPFGYTDTGIRKFKFAAKVQFLNLWKYVFTVLIIVSSQEDTAVSVSSMPDPQLYPRNLETFILSIENNPFLNSETFVSNSYNWLDKDFKESIVKRRIDI